MMLFRIYFYDSWGQRFTKVTTVIELGQGDIITAFN